MHGSPKAAFIPGEVTFEQTPWLEPFPDAWLEVADSAPGPEARYESKESIELAFVAALQLLPPRQRAVLVLRDVLGWSAHDAASLLDVSLPAVNSALQRARARLGARTTSTTQRLSAAAEQALVERYVQAWEQSDVEALVAMLKEDAVLSMPPLAEWYVGRAAIAQFLRWVFGPEGGGPFRYVPTRANGGPALGVYRGGTTPFILHVMTADRAGVASMISFMNPALFEPFNLPLDLAQP
jgi:RNA polymerase sigma-70 factor (ECF subfamily)